MDSGFIPSTTTSSQAEGRGRSKNGYHLHKTILFYQTMPRKKQEVKTIVVYTTVKEVRKEYTPKVVKPSQSGACYRCGRTSHYASDCYARTDTDGNELD